jgi:hypothetical protein
MKTHIELRVYRRANDAWYWYMYSSSTVYMGSDYGPFKIEALARKDARDSLHRMIPQYIPY